MRQVETEAEGSGGHKTPQNSGGLFAEESPCGSVLVLKWMLHHLRNNNSQFSHLETTGSQFSLMHSHSIID